MSVVPSGESSGKSPDALSSRAALVDVIAVDDVGDAGVSGGDVGAAGLGWGLGELVALAQADTRAMANRKAGKRMSYMMRSGRGAREKGEAVRMSLPGAAELARVMDAEAGNPYQQIHALYWSIGATALASVCENVRTSLIELVAELRRGMLDPMIRFQLMLPRAPGQGSMVVVGNAAATSGSLAQLVEQWSEESRTPRFAKLLGNSRLIPTFGPKEQWSQRSIVLKCGGQAAHLVGVVWWNRFVIVMRGRSNLTPDQPRTW